MLDDVMFSFTHSRAIYAWGWCHQCQSDEQHQKPDQRAAIKVKVKGLRRQ